MNLSVDSERILAAESDERSLEICVRMVTDALMQRTGSAPD